MITAEPHVYITVPSLRLWAKRNPWTALALALVTVVVSVAVVVAIVAAIVCL